MLAPLPEGPGIAAKYAGDKDIERDPAVVFADGFETYPTGPLPGGFRKGNEKRWDNSGGLCRVTDAAAEVNGGGQALEMLIRRPGDTPGGAGVQKHFEEGLEFFLVPDIDLG